MTLDWKPLFLSMDGRIARGPFWIGLLIILAASLLLNLFGIVGSVLGIPLIWPQVALHAKRLHDIGRSAWLILIPFALTLVATVLVMMSAGRGQDVTVAAVAFGLAVVVGLAFLCWVGLSRGQPADNRFGPAPTPAPSKDL